MPPREAPVDAGRFARDDLAAPGLEWLEADGRGGFASGAVAGPRTRRYHALLLAAVGPGARRMALVNGVEAWVETATARFALSAQRYGGDVVHPDGARRIEAFWSEPWPTWQLRTEDGVVVVHEILVERAGGRTLLSWRLAAPAQRAILVVRPLLSGRDMHALHRENPSFRFATETGEGCVAWRPYEGVPGIAARHNGTWSASPDWYRGFAYDDERERGLDDREDLASPGTWRFDLARGPALVALAVAGRESDRGGDTGAGLAADAERWRARERERRCACDGPLERAVDDYVVDLDGRRGIVAGYPWFGERARDTFVALRGLCLATGRLDDALRIALAWGDRVVDGLLPDRLDAPAPGPVEGSVDAALWFVVVVRELLARLGDAASPGDRLRLDDACRAILDGCARGTRRGIRCDDDGLLAAGEGDLALTWMDARVDGRPVVQRSGKPVEVQALWLNALAGEGDPRSRAILARGLASFRERFWDPARGHLADVVDVAHVRGTADGSLRPNQLLAVGGLPLSLVEPAVAARVVEVAERRLWTPWGPRSLAPGEAGYVGRCEGGVVARDRAYHQGTAWPWLAGAFVEAWVRVHGGDDAARCAARARFLAPLLAHLRAGGLGHLPEIADGDPPQRPRGCPWQAWSVAEALRLDREVLAPRASVRGGSRLSPA